MEGVWGRTEIMCNKEFRCLQGFLSMEGGSVHESIVSVTGGRLYAGGCLHEGGLQGVGTVVWMLGGPVHGGHCVHEGAGGGVHVHTKGRMCRAQDLVPQQVLMQPRRLIPCTLTRHQESRSMTQSGVRLLDAGSAMHACWLTCCDSEQSWTGLHQCMTTTAG